MANPHVRIDRKGDRVKISFVRSVGKSTRVAKVVNLDAPTIEEMDDAIHAGLVEVRLGLGVTGKLVLPKGSPK